MISSNTTRSLLDESPGEYGPDAHRAAPVWNGFLHEFRNHLTVLIAATSELRTEIPPSIALRVGDAVFEMERSVQGLTSIVGIVDASIRGGEPVIARLGDVVDRAIRLAAPSAGRRATFTANVPRETGVRNRGAVLESLIAVLAVDLSRRSSAKSFESPNVRIDADAGRAGLVIEISSEGALPDPSSWRCLLAEELAGSLDAALGSDADANAYVLQLR
jgi:hypothetical protein